MTARSYRIREYDEDPSINSNDTKGGGATAEWREFLVQSGSCALPVETTASASATTTSAHDDHAAANLSIMKVRRWLRAPLSVARDLFLPLGYPATVREGYLEYQIYDSIQGLCSYLRGVLCSAQVLQAAGVGNEQATAMGAALTWALKDGAGMIGGLFFSYMASPLFDGHVKEFRLFADVINDVAMALDMLAPYFCGVGTTLAPEVSSRRLLYISSLSTLCKTMCGMSAGATKASITQYFAITGNMADLNAKESTQETLMSLMGMLLGATLANRLSNYEATHEDLIMPIQWSIFIFLTMVHVWANYKGVALLRLLTLNRERAEVILENLILSNGTKKEQDTIDIELLRRIPKPTDVYESMWASTCKMLWPGRDFQLATHRLTDLVSIDPTLIEQLENDTHSNDRYALSLVGDGPLKQRQILVCLLSGAGNRDELKAFCHAYYLRHVVLIRKEINDKLKGKPPSVQNRALLQAAATAIQSWFDDDATSSNHDTTTDDDCGPLMSTLARQGWDVHGRLYLGFSRRRSQWRRGKDE